MSPDHSLNDIEEHYNFTMQISVFVVFLLCFKECYLCNNYLDYCDGMEENAESTNLVKINKWRRVGRITESERLKIVKVKS